MSRLKIPKPPRSVVEDAHRQHREHLEKLAKDSGDVGAQLPPATLNRRQRRMVAADMRKQLQTKLRREARERDR